MGPLTISFIGFAAILVLAFLRFPLALSMGLVGVIGFGELTNYRAAISNIGRLVMDLGQSYSLSVLPLFILMGLLVEKGGMAKQLYRAAYAFLGDKKGGLAMSTVVARGMFSAISGSSIATAATMSKVAMPEMRRYKYADSLATASIAAGGTLGILIPPSVILVIYGLLTEQSIGKLFMAGFLPGMLGILFYTLAVFFVVSRNPSLGPAGEKTNWPERLLALKNVWTTLTLFIFVIGGIYIGLFSATEAAGMGAAGVAVGKILIGAGVGEIVGVDRAGAVYQGRENLNVAKEWFANNTNPDRKMGTLNDVIKGSDIFIGLSGPGLIDASDLRNMASDPIVFAMANPDPEIRPEEADGLAAVMATGRSDYPNQINNVLAFPGIFRGALDVGATQITENMKLAAAKAIADSIEENDLNPDFIVPSVFNKSVPYKVAEAVARAALNDKVCR